MRLMAMLNNQRVYLLLVKQGPIEFLMNTAGWETSQRILIVDCCLHGTWTAKEQNQQNLGGVQSRTDNNCRLRGYMSMGQNI